MIVKFIKTQGIKKIYNNRKTDKYHRWGAKPGYDYIVISVETIVEYKKYPITSFRYWIINDQECLLPYDAYNFKIIDSTFPSSWVFYLNERGISISHPKWAQYGYVEDYFDNIKVEREYNKIVKEIFDESVCAALNKGIRLKLGIKKLWTERLSD